MPVDAKKLAVVLAGPRDVEREIELIREAIVEVNITLRFAAASIVLEPLHWRTDVYPGFHPEGPPGLIDQCKN